MYRGSRLVASFLLILTGAPMTALALGVLPGATFSGGAWVVVPLAVAFGVAHFVALGGMVVGRAWGRTLAVGLAEAGGGISIAAAIAVLLGADPLGAAGGPAYATWLYGLHIYEHTFKYFDMGYGSTLAWIMFIGLSAFTYMQFRASRDLVYYAGEGR